MTAAAAEEWFMMIDTDEDGYIGYKEMEDYCVGKLAFNKEQVSELDTLLTAKLSCSYFLQISVRLNNCLLADICVNGSYILLLSTTLSCCLYCIIDVILCAKHLSSKSELNVKFVYE